MFYSPEDRDRMAAEQAVLKKACGWDEIREKREERERRKRSNGKVMRNEKAKGRESSTSRCTSR